MAILWCGSEDVDFPVGTGTMQVATSGNGAIRAGYNRGSVANSNATTANFLQTRPFAGGAVTSAWLSFRLSPTSAAATNRLYAGVSLSTTAKGLYVGSGAASKFALLKFDGTTVTTLASESGTTLANAGAYRIDLQIVNYGASATVNMYVNGVLLVTYAGDVTVAGMSNFDSLTMPGGNSPNTANCSEFIVASEDTRPFLGLLTMAPTAVGTTGLWTNNAFTNVNPVTITDANAASTNTGAQDQQYALTDEPSGTFVVRAVRVAARAWITSGATANKIKLGFNSGGSVAVGTLQALSTGPTTYEQLWDATNPVTGSPWGDVTEINALQVDLQSST